MNNHYLKYKQLICVRIWEDLQARQVSKGEDWGKQACRLECHKQGYGNKTDKRVTSKRPSDCHGSATDLVQIAKEKNHWRKTVVATVRVQRETLKKSLGCDKYRRRINPEPKVWQFPSLVHFDSSTVSTTASFYAHWVKVSFFFSCAKRFTRHSDCSAQPPPSPPASWAAISIHSTPQTLSSPELFRSQNLLNWTLTAYTLKQIYACGKFTPSAALPRWGVRTSELGDTSHTILKAAATAGCPVCTGLVMVQGFSIFQPFCLFLFVWFGFF